MTLDLGVKVTRNVAQYPLCHMTYPGKKFKVATSNGLGGDTFTRKVRDGHTDGLWYKINIPFFSKEKSGYNINKMIVQKRRLKWATA